MGCSGDPLGSRGLRGGCYMITLRHTKNRNDGDGTYVFGQKVLEHYRMLELELVIGRLHVQECKAPGPVKTAGIP